MERSRPLGYWLKLLDQLIEEHLDRALAPEGIRRRHWQTLNLLRSMPDRDHGGGRGPAGKEAVVAELRPFWAAGGPTVDEVLDELAGRGWITRREPHRLTGTGEAAHGVLARIVERAGRQIDEGITAQQHAHTVEVLRRMTENAENLREVPG